MSDLIETIKWWEKKRLIYTIITALGGLFVILIKDEVPNSYSSTADFGAFLILLFGANIFYTMSWSSELLLNYYF